MKKSCLFLNLDKKIIILNTCEGNRGIRFIFLGENLSLWMSCTIVFTTNWFCGQDTILNDMGEAEDLVQDFFVRLWEKKFERESGGGTDKVILVCVRAEYGNSEGEGSGAGSDGFRMCRLWKECGRMRIWCAMK